MLNQLFGIYLQCLDNILGCVYRLHVSPAQDNFFGTYMLRVRSRARVWIPILSCDAHPLWQTCSISSRMKTEAASRHTVRGMRHATIRWKGNSRSMPARPCMVGRPSSVVVGAWRARHPRQRDHWSATTVIAACTSQRCHNPNWM